VVAEFVSFGAVILEPLDFSQYFRGHLSIEIPISLIFQSADIF
jgi:hypothetical protein